jgi:hypothetical protein
MLAKKVGIYPDYPDIESKKFRINWRAFPSIWSDGIGR